MLYEPSVLSQYANSPIINALLASFEEALEPQFDAFYEQIWNIDTAVGYGLDVWGRILGVSRVLAVPEAGDFLGFVSAASADTFGHGIWYKGAGSTSNYALSDDAYRLLLFAKAALNITNSSASSINAIMMALFPDHGNCYVRDDGGMAMTYVFGAPLTPVESSIVTQSGVLPKPIGVTASVETP